MNTKHALRSCAILAAIFLATPAGATPIVGPTAPGQLVAMPIAPGVIALSWEPASSPLGVASYRVYVLAADGNATLLAQTGGNETSFIHEGLPAGETFTYAVSAVDLVGEGPVSEPASATTWSAPSAPVQVAVASGPGPIGEATVTWAAPESDGGAPIVAYNVYRDGVLVATTRADTLTWTDASLTPLHAYSFAVTALNDVGEGAMSDPACGMASPWLAELGCGSVL